MKVRDRNEPRRTKMSSSAKLNKEAISVISKANNQESHSKPFPEAKKNKISRTCSKWIRDKLKQTMKITPWTCSVRPTLVYYSLLYSIFGYSLPKSWSKSTTARRGGGERLLSVTHQTLGSEERESHWRGLYQYLTFLTATFYWRCEATCLRLSGPEARDLVK